MSDIANESEPHDFKPLCLKCDPPSSPSSDTEDDSQLVSMEPTADITDNNILQNSHTLLVADTTQQNRTGKVGATTITKRMISKRLRNKGLQYVNRKGIHIAAKKMKNGCVECKFKCKRNINNDERAEIFKNFWNIGNVNIQNQFIASLIEVREPELRRAYKGKRKECNVYYFKKNNSKIRVCAKYFIETLSISNTRIQIALKKRTSSGIGTSDIL